jgi:predicted SAM-dependent methyltransferase
MGCGSRNFGKDWIHIDGGDYPHLDYHDITKLEFEDESVDLIYASHVIEYFNDFEVKELLTEWKRVLKEGKILRLSVPNFEALCELYKSGTKLYELTGPLYGRIWMKDKWIYHKTVYDYDRLYNLLYGLKFRNIIYWHWQDYIGEQEDDFSRAYIPYKTDKIIPEVNNLEMLISLNMEAVK